jgi:uncharacterized membrane protein YebE (DUF533 family)
MFDADDLVRGVLTGVMGGRRKKSRKALRYLTGRGGGMLSNPNTLLTVAGMAWGIFETMQGQNQPQRQPEGAGSFGSPATPASVIPVPPLPSVPGPAPTVMTDALRMIRLTIAAASADGTLSDEDRASIVEQAKAADAEHLVERELENRRPVAEIVAGVTDPAQRATLYVLAFGIIRADESVSGAERIFLAQLAHQLGLDPPTVAKLEADASAKIDAQD